MIHNILHLSDFHFSNDDESYLRDNQDKFIEELISEIGSVESKVDYLVLTGDYVERGNWDVENQISSFIKKIETTLQVKSTFCVNGNHDLDEEGNVKSEFFVLKSKLNGTDPIIDEGWFKAYEITDNHWVLEFNCFFNGKREVLLNKERDFKPLMDSQLKLFEDFITQRLTKGKQTIYILSHLPVKVNPNSQLLEDLSWEERHLWNDGNNILKIISRNIDVNVLLWFAGDGHVVESYKQSDLPFYYFLTGRFNGPIEKYGKDRAKNAIKEASCQFIRVDTIKRKVVRTIKFSTFQERYDQASFKWYSKSLDFISSTKFLNKYFTENKKQEELNDEITRAIGEGHLYELVKATTKNKNITLGWIDINGLINHDNVLKQFIECASALLDIEYKGEYKDMMILGLGYWGASTASFISISKNIPMVSLKVRGCNLKEHAVLSQQFHNKNVIIVTDVVSSGETLDELREVLNIKDFSCLISIILNPCITNNLRGIDRIIYGSNQIALPIIERENLPDSILFPRYDFGRNG